MKRSSGFLLAFALWPGCATTPRAETTAQKSTQIERFDPQSLGEDQLLIQPAFSPQAVEEKSAASLSSSTNSNSGLIYRVQIMSLSYGREGATDRRGVGTDPRSSGFCGVGARPLQSPRRGLSHRR